MARLTVDDLIQALEPEGARDRFNVFDRFCKLKPTEDAIPVLRRALADDHHSVVKCAAHSLRKLGPAANIAMKDLIAAAQKTDHSGLPQAYAECITAMVEIDPDHERLIPMIKRFVGLDNWVPISASLKALHKIGSPESIDLLHRMATFWTPEFNKTQLRIVDGLLASISADKNHST